MERMEEGRPYPHSQPLAEQDGKRNTKTAGQSGSLHNAGTIHRPGNCRHRMLAVGQLLVARPRLSGDDSGLTNTQTGTPELCAHHRRGGKRIIEHILARVDHRQRLASRGFNEWRLDKSVTSDSAR
ncbi:uncharacterized protein LOC123317949 [Coccinella septempunctata]|uniref:uncharacterized protein LOC123317949 n=1 Tax=Coccinella septempunctata TaxID=41139 RepID=UPI001D097EF7|nr:uncharacterized protein LOC123317949 [Coccinella septempunctata]